MGLLFYPRGGSAQVARYLAAALDRKGWTVRLFTGSLGEPGAGANAATFFAGLDVAAADFTRALEAFDRGDDRWPLRSRCIRRSRVVGGARPTLRVARRSRGRATGRRLARLLPRAGAEAAIAHSSLTPQHDALVRVAPSLPLSRTCTAPS